MYGVVGFARRLRVNFASTKNINLWWNFRSLSGVWMAAQIFSGLVISSTLVAGVSMSFDSVEAVMENGMRGAILRFIHANFCSWVFVIMIVHVRKRLYYKSFLKRNLWKVGTVLLILTMGASFLGYVLPWGHMSFWRATVITSLLTVLPIGDELVIYVWGRFSLGGACLRRFFTLHFLLPILILGVIVLHLHILHEYVSGSPIGGRYGNIFSGWYNKDRVTVFGSVLVIILIIALCAVIFIDADNWAHCDPMKTPEHIKPEWYFLFAYCILRCIPSKPVGVCGLVRSLLMVISIGIVLMRNVLLVVFALLTWLGGVSLDKHFIIGSQVMSLIYFLGIII